MTTTFATGRDGLRTAIDRIVTDRVTADGVRAVCAALGVPRADWEQVSRWATSIDASSNPLCAYLDVMVADRCRNLGNDLLSDLILAEEGGDELTADDLRALVVTLLVRARRSDAAWFGPSL